MPVVNDTLTCVIYMVIGVIVFSYYMRTTVLYDEETLRRSIYNMYKYVLSIVYMYIMV